MEVVVNGAGMGSIVQRITQCSELFPVRKRIRYGNVMPQDDALGLPLDDGNYQAFERLYRDHFARVRSFLRIYLGNAAAVEDLAQDTFLQVWLHPNRYDPTRSNLKTYLFTIARRRAADWFRHRQPAVDDEDRAAPTATHSGDTFDLKDALDRLPTDLRNALWLREVEGYSYDELAAILDIPLGTVRSRLFAAREQLRRIWKSK